MANELSIIIDVDTQDAKRALGDVEGKLDDVTKAAEKTGDAVSGYQKQVDDLVQSKQVATGALDTFRGALTTIGTVLKSLSFSTVRQGINEVAEAAGLTVSKLGLMNSAGLIVGAAYAGWGIGRMIADFFDLDKKIGNATSRLLGFGDVAAQTAGAKQDVINKAIRDGAAATITYTDAIEFNRNVALETTKAWKELADSTGAWQAQLDRLKSVGALDKLKADIQQHVLSVKELADRYQITVHAVELYKEQIREADEVARKQEAAREAALRKAEAAREAAHRAKLRADAEDDAAALKQEEALARLYEKVHQLEFGYEGLGTAIEHVGTKSRTDLDFAKEFSKNYEAVKHLEDGIEGIGRGLEHVGTKVPPVEEKLLHLWDRQTQEIDHLIRALDDIASHSSGAFSSIVKGLADVVDAFQRGRKAAADYYAAQQNGDKFGQGVALVEGGANVVSSTDPSTHSTAGGIASGAASGAALGTMILPGWGTAIGAVAGAVVGWVRSMKASADELAARSTWGEFQKQFGTLQQAINGVGQAYADVGLTGADAQRDLGRALDATHISAEAEAAALSTINIVLAEAKKRTQDIADGVNRVSAAAQVYGRQLPENIRASIRAMMDMKGITEEERTSLQGLLDAGKPNFQALTDKAASFGITIDGLGPKFQQVQIEARSKDLTDFLTDATQAGGDVGGMLAGLSDEISSLVNDSKKFGTAIPDNMRPYIEELIRAHKLTDENGKAIDDITGITFEATPLDEGLKGLTNAINDLIKLLGGNGGVSDLIKQVGDHANNIPKNPFADWKVPDLPHESLPTIPMAAGGYGRVTKPTLFYSAGNEDYAFSGEGKRFSSQTSTVTHTGDVHVTLNLPPGNYKNPQALADAVASVLKHNTRGLKSKVLQLAR